MKNLSLEGVLFAAKLYFKLNHLANHGESLILQNINVQFIAVENKPEANATPSLRRIAYRLRQGGAPTLVWLGGFKSDMMSTKAQALDEWAAKSGFGFLRFDYSGHGESESATTGERFQDGTISRCLEDALAILALVQGPIILVGSSMGGWLSLLAEKSLRVKGMAGRIQGMVLIAPAVDFTQRLMWAQFSPAIRDEIEHNGVWYLPTPHAPNSWPITRALIEDGRTQLVFGAPLEVDCPVHILQGQQDPDVPWTHAMTLMEHLPAAQATLTLVKDGDHRLSRPQDIELLLSSVERMAQSLP